MRPKKSNNNKQLLNTLCQLIFERKFKEAEKTLLDFIGKVLTLNRNLDLNPYKEAISNIYHSFNYFYLNYLVENKIDIKKGLKELSLNKHSNYFIAQCSKIAEMDDLLFDLINYLNSTVKKEEVVHGLSCYRKY